jgi:CIC family chloride channel protein
LLKIRVWLGELLRPNELQATLFWAGVIGFVGAVASVAFRKLMEAVQSGLTQHDGGLVESFAHLAWWQRLLIPTFGGALAGATIVAGMRLARKSSTDYMEAIVLGDGAIPVRLSLVKSTSAMFSIASGGSIGREGPLVQLSAMLASLLGRLLKKPTVQLRLLVACGAAAGIASAYNAPIGGALFVAEIVLGSLAMESFGPLVFASVVATLTVRQLLGSNPLYEIDIPATRLASTWEIAECAALGLIAGLIAPWFLRLLHWSEQLFLKIPAPNYVKLAVGGLIVGLLAIVRPEVCGNGYTVLNEILYGNLLWQALLLVLALKLLATAATFGSGAVGGVSTPTLFVGACIGQLVAAALHGVWGTHALGAFPLVGMGALLAATTHAPIMAIIMLFELTLDYEIILPLMLACVIAHYTSSALEKKSIYSESLRRKGAGSFRQQLASMRVADLMKTNPPAVNEMARFSEIAAHFIRNRFNYLYVVDDDQCFKGVVSLHDVKSYLQDPDLAQMVIARDILRELFPTITSQATLAIALQQFSHHDGERLPVVAELGSPRLVGTISKTDLILAFAEQTQEETAASGACT